MFYLCTRVFLTTTLSGSQEVRAGILQAYSPVIFWYLKAASPVVIAGVQPQGRQRRRPSAGSASALGAGPHSGAPVPGPGGARRAGPLLVQGLPHPPPRGASEPLHPQVPRVLQMLDGEVGSRRVPRPPRSLRYARAPGLRNQRAWPA